MTSHTPQRSVPKNDNSNPRREEALSRLRDRHTVSEVAAFAGVHRSTVTRWARDAGIDPGTNAERTRRATVTRAAQLTANTVERLEYIIGLASTGLIRRLEANADAAELDDEDLGEWSAVLGRWTAHTPAGEAAIRRYRYLTTLEPTRALVGSLTRAIADLATLQASATERGPIVVQFGIPRPVDDGDILDGTIPSRQPARPV